MYRDIIGITHTVFKRRLGFGLRSSGLGFMVLGWRYCMEHTEFLSHHFCISIVFGYLDSVSSEKYVFIMDIAKAYIEELKVLFLKIAIASVLS
jgi:hypothetical protein